MKSSLTNMPAANLARLAAMLERSGFTPEILEDLSTGKIRLDASDIASVHKTNGANDKDAEASFECRQEFQMVVPKGFEYGSFLHSVQASLKMDPRISDAFCSRATDRIIAGQKIMVRIYKSQRLAHIPSSEMLAFMKAEGALFLGTQGAALIATLGAHQLLNGWYISLDLEEALPKDDNDSLVPVVERNCGVCSVRLGDFAVPWKNGNHLIVFTRA